MTKNLKSGVAYAMPLAKGCSFALLGMLFAPLKSHADVAQGAAWLKANLSLSSSMAVDAQAVTESVHTLSKLNIATGSIDLDTLLQNEHSTEILSRVALVASLRGQSPSIYFTELKASQNEDGGFGHLEGWQSNPLDTAFVLLALSETQFIENLASASEKQQWLDIQYRALGYLKSQQRSDGSYQVLSLDKLYVSAYVLNALSRNIPVRSDITQNVIVLVNYLEQAKIAPAQWSSSSQGLFIDALVAEALHPFHAVDQQVTEFAFRQRVLDLQQGNGSWSSDPYTTALMLRSLNAQATAAVNPVTSGVRLQVIDTETGLPLSGVNLSSANPVLNQSSDANGQIIISSAPAGQIRFTLQRAGYAGIQFDITLRQGEQLNLGQIKLSRATTATTAQIQGKVVDFTTGGAVAGAQVTVVMVDANGQPLPNTSPQVVFTDGEGGYQVILGQGGSFGIDIRKDGYAPVQGSGSVPHGNTTVFSPKLTALSSNVASAQGKVVNGSNQPLSGVSIIEDGVVIATTDLQGLFSISGVQAGSKQWLVSKQGYLQATVGLSLQAGQHINVGTISLPVQPVSIDPNNPAPITIATGNLMVAPLDSRNNESISGFTIEGEQLDSMGYIIQRQSFKADEVGANSAELKLPAGKWRIAVKHPAYQTATQTLNLGAGQQLSYQPKMVLNSYAIMGVVVDSLTNRPIPNAPVQILNAATKAVIYSTKTDSNGKFTSLNNLTVQDVQVEIKTTLYLPTTRFIRRDVQTESTMDMGEIRLRPESAEVVLPDLAVSGLDVGRVQTDLQALTISGVVTAQLANKGNTGLNVGNVTVTAFEDANYNRVLDADELVLGQAIYNNALAADAVDSIDIPVQGRAKFRDAPIAVMVDSQNQVAERNEKNNVRLSSDGLEIKPQQGTMDAEVVWKANYNSDSGVVVAPLKDTNNDGVIGRGDVASVIVYANGVFRVLNGKTGQLEFSINTSLGGQSLAAVGDVDGDGLPDIVATVSNGIAIYSNLGALKKIIPATGLSNGGWAADAYHPILADIDQDGAVEIIQNDRIYSYKNGLLLNNLASGQSQAVADVDGDGYLDIIGLKGATNRFGNKLYEFKNKAGSALTLKFLAVGDVLGNGKPQITAVYSSLVYIFDAKTGAEIASYSAPSTGGGSPVIADFNGDGVADIGVARASAYVALRGDGSVIWSAPIADGSAGTGSTVFDFDNDGQAEAVHFDEQFLRIYDSKTGVERIKIPNTTATAHEYPVVADVDADGHADIVMTSGSGDGVRMISGKNKDWADTRNIWNQYSYHVTNINDDLTIPVQEPNSWEVHNTYRANLLLNQSSTAAMDLSASYLRFSDNGIFSPSRLTARIGNAGGKNVPTGTPVSFYRVPPAVNGVASQPQLIKSLTLTEPLVAGHYQDISVDYTGDMSNFGELVVVANDAGAGLDSLTGIPVNAPNNAGVVQEYTRANNLARLAFGSGFQNYSLDGLINKSSYTAGESVQISAIPSNLGSLSSDVIVRIRIVDSAGNVVATLPEQLASLAGSVTGDGSNSKTILVPWAVGQAHAGNYRAIIELVRDGWFGQETVASVERSFNVVSDANNAGLTGLSVQVDRTQYSVGDTVSVTSRLQNTASNEVASPRTVTLALLDPSGNVIWTQTTAYGELPPNGLVDNTYQLPLAQVAAGSYQLRATSHAPDGSQADQVSTRSFTVLSAAQSGVGISGSIQSAASVDVGSPIQFIWSINNQANSTLNGINTRILLVDAETDTLMNTISSGSQTVAAGGNTGQQVAEWASAGNPEQRIMAILQVYLDKPGLPEQERWRTLSSTAFKLTVPPLKVSFDDVQKTGKPVLIYYSCYDGWQDWLSSWLLGGYDSACFSEREAQIKSYLNRIKVPYTMVKEPWQFRDRMHSGVYGQYWVLGTIEALTPHGYKELRESAHLGDNLLVDNGIQSHQNAHLFALAGSRFRGRMQLTDGVITPKAANAGLPALLTVPDNAELAATPLKTTTARKGQSLTANWPLVLEPISNYTQVSATFDGSKKVGILIDISLESGAKPISYFQSLSTYPAVTMAPYGRGKPVALAFDLPASLSLANGGQIPATNNLVTLPQKRWDAALTELLTPRQSVARSSYVPNEPVHIPLTLDNQSSQPRTVQLEVELPSGAQWLGREGGTQNTPASSQSQAKVTYQLTLPANSKSTEVVALRLPAASGSHVVRTSVLGVVGGSINPQALAQQENRYVVRTLDERFNLLKQSINNWNSSAGANWLELTALKTHFLLLDTHYRLGQWELALLQAGHVSDDLAAMRSAQDSRITANRIELDEFMRGLQIRWYLQRNGQRPAP